MMLQTIAVLLLVTVGALADYRLKKPQITRLSPLGIHIAYPNEDGLSTVTIHFSVNQPITGYNAGQYKIHLKKNQANWWTHTDMDIAVNARDTVHFRLDVVHNGKLHHLNEQAWKAIDVDQQADGCSSYPCTVFEDNFDTLNLDTWQHEITAGGGGNWEFQHYTNNRSNSYVRDGILYLKPTLTTDKFSDGFLESGVLEIWGASPADLCTGNQFYGCRRQGTSTNYINPIQSARVRSVLSFSFEYGKIEFEAKLPQGDWIWPALWLLPTQQYYAGWPSSGEVDVMESRGNRGLRDPSGNSMGVDRMGATLHWGPNGANNRYYLTNGHRYASSGNYGDSFHKYSMEWDENQMIFQTDGVETLRVDPGPGGFWEFGGFNNSNLQNPWRNQGKMAPFDKKFYIIMNVAVGGTNGYFSDSNTNDGYQKPWSNTSPTGPRDFWLGKNNWYPTWNPTTNNGEDAAMAINYVKVTKLKPDP